VNTLGTQLIADLASKYKVDKFVFISTDKAVNPTNVMGASKRLAEMYVQSLNKSHKNDTRFIVTRFGNVLGSNGSVIPLFKKQIEKGGPVTVTHKDIIRYFMTIPEACQLVLEAGTMGKGGEIYVFDMGFPVRIVELAERMIKLSGFEPYTEIAIEFSGLRPGEKLYEELLGSEETTIATHHPKIMVAKVNAGEYEELKNSFDAVRYRANEMQPIELVKFLKSMVPDYISNNSTYQSLDNIPK
jgi:FlaA1/EpsC-like NDP-sugar epimerase